MGHGGSVICAAAVVVMVTQLAVDDTATLALIAGCLIGVAGLRMLDLRRGRGATRAA